MDDQWCQRDEGWAEGNGMTHLVSDSFNQYAAVADASAGIGTTSPNWAFSASWILNSSGRYTGQKCLALPASNNIELLGSQTFVNDSTVVFRCSFIQVSALTGTNQGLSVVLFDGLSAQITLVFRSDGAILILSGGLAGTTIGTYTGAFISNVWTPFEIQVVIHNTAGSVTILTNGNTLTGSPDFQITNVNTRGGSTNNYCNNLQIWTSSGATTIGASNQKIGDVLLFAFLAVRVSLRHLGQGSRRLVQSRSGQLGGAAKIVLAQRAILLAIGVPEAGARALLLPRGEASRRAAIGERPRRVQPVEPARRPHRYRRIGWVGHKHAIAHGR